VLGAVLDTTMPAIPDSVRALVAEGHLAHLVTRNADGSPQVSVVWMGVEGDELVSAHLGEHLKVRNLRRDPHAVISMESEVVQDHGLQQHLIAHCTARVTQGGAAALLQELAHVYLGPDVKFPPIDDPPPGFILRFTIDRIGGVGPWAG
jgi:PPOX class probable F420-dependent enzyme